WLIVFGITNQKQNKKTCFSRFKKGEHYSIELKIQTAYYSQRFIFFFKYEIIQDTVFIELSDEFLHTHDSI
ncbi:MAG TPA: hypothetical protein CFH84_02250, partial [Sulfurimonas sp. UBA12504]